MGKADDARTLRALRNAGKPDLTGEELGEVVRVFEKAAGVGHGYEDKGDKTPPPSTKG